jgi:hypothetical protein
MNPFILENELETTCSNLSESTKQTRRSNGDATKWSFLALLVACFLVFCFSTSQNVQVIHRLLQSTTGQHHKALLPLDKTDVIGFTCATLGLMIAAGGGIGKNRRNPIVSMYH